jgi:hypothetical protein
VRIFARQVGDRVHLTVEDDGPGMSPQVRDRCMEPFFTTKSRGISTGLGLVLVAGLVRDAGGTVSLRTAPGEGAAFTLDVPLATRPVGKQAARGVAIVDVRDPRLRALARAELEFLAFEILGPHAPDGAPVDIAVLDRPADGRARQVVLLDDAQQPPSHVVPIGPSPAPGQIRSALRAAAEHCAEKDPNP